MRTIAAATLFCSLALAVPAVAQTQITTGVIEGMVTDASGAVLPGVSVDARNAETNLTRTLTTDRDGRFVLLQLPSGRYTVTFKLSGFATLVQENIQVTVGQSVRLTPPMKVSGVAETVTVTARRRPSRPAARRRPPRSTRRRSATRRFSDASSKIC